MSFLDLFSQNIKKYHLSNKSTEFQQTLLYGLRLKRLNLLTGKIEFSIVYLHEMYTNMLVILPQYKIIDLQRCRLEKAVPRLEFQYGIKYYVVVRDGSDLEVIVFDNLPYRNGVYTQMVELLDKVRQYKSEIDTSTLKLFLEADYSCNGHLNQQQLLGLMSRLKITPDQHIQKLIKYVGRDLMTGGEINLNQFEMFSMLLSCRLEVKGVFEKYAKEQINSYERMLEGVMDRNGFEMFLRNQQKMVDPTERLNIVDSVYMGRGDRMSFFNFCAFIFSNKNSITDSQSQHCPFQQSHPLHHYYCFSSHNTYLSGNQLTSTSKVQRYVEDLEQGVRCVELDIHDDGPTPIIKHGYTATKPIKFESVIHAIARFCETESEHTPIILSLENHCCLENKNKVASILLRYFSENEAENGRILVVEGDTYPSLNNLRGRIIVKGSGMYKELIEGKIDEEEEQEEEDDEEVKNEGAGVKRMPVNFLKKKQEFCLKENQLREKKKQMKKKFNFLVNYMSDFKLEKKNTSKQLLSLTSMLSSGKLGGNPNCWQSVSITEGKMKSLIMEKKESLTLHTKGSWIRVYPSGARFDSSNYNPIPMLQVGAQIVALNTQCKSLQMNILSSFFTGNKNQKGYQLKPQYLRNYSKKHLQTQKTIKILILSCHSITPNEPTPTIPPILVKIGFFGSLSDMSLNPNSGQLFPFTQTIQNNCFNPIFKLSQEFICRVRDPFFAFVCFVIEGCGQAAVPVRYLRAGYRNVSLLDGNLKECGASILVHVDIE